MAKVLLATLNSKYIHTNLAIRILYQLNKDYEGLSWKEFNIKENPEEISDTCLNYDVIAFSCYIWNITQTLNVAKLIKEKNPNIKILLGGPEVSYDYNDIITLPYVDYIIVGEGETPFKEFLNNPKEPQFISGLVYKNGSEIIQNKPAANFDLKNFQDIMPYQDDGIESLKSKVLYIETSRGCPYKCEFCLASLDNKVRYLPNDCIKNTLLFMMNHGKVIKFLDRTFNIKKDFTLDIFKFILENRKPENIFQFEITADILHPDIIEFINQEVPKGLFRFEIGIQTVNQKANLEVSRKQNFEKTKKIIQALDYKIEMHLDLIVGLPLDEWEDIKYSIEEVFKLFPPELQLGFLKFLKGTPVREKYEQYDFVFDPMPPYQIIESKFLSKEQLQKITQLEHALEIYWNGKKTIHTLKYVTQHYSIFDFLLGLGIYFGTQKSYHQYTLTDVYDIITDYAKIHYPNDDIIPQLIAVDYYLHYKVKPKELYLSEPDKSEKFKLIEAYQLNHHKYRFVVLPLNFDFHHFVSTLQIVKESSPIFIQYDGQNKAQVVEINKHTSVI
jgi:anaerobic magnesium-protoporphyrin IX monomethyl ester cyclase